LQLHRFGNFHRSIGLGVTGGGRFQTLCAGGVFAHQTFVATLVETCAAQFSGHTAGVSLSLGNAGLLLGDQAVSDFQVGLLRRHRGLGLGQFCAGLCQAGLVVTVLDAHQHIPRLDRLIVLYHHLGHVA